tara:strand:- start:234 stop:440 length:207 start_codon:yes stop_codon:yes gene_type:complete
MKTMTPRKIVEMRKRHGIRSAERLAVILGLGLSSVKRWEAGYNKPSKSANYLLRIFDKYGEEFFRELD